MNRRALRQEVRDLRSEVRALQAIVSHQTTMIRANHERVILQLDLLSGGAEGVVVAEPGLSDDEWFRKYFPLVAARSRDNA